MCGVLTGSRLFKVLTYVMSKILELLAQGALRSKILANIRLPMTRNHTKPAGVNLGADTSAENYAPKADITRAVEVLPLMSANLVLNFQLGQEQVGTMVLISCPPSALEVRGVSKPRVQILVVAEKKKRKAPTPPPKSRANPPPA